MARTREAQFGPHATYIGTGVGKSFHWSYAVGSDGSEVPGSRLGNRREDADALIDEADEGALVVVDQKNNIGSLVVRRCNTRSVGVGYMSGLTMKKARDM